jgi:hypothetical protein
MQRCAAQVATISVLGDLVQEAVAKCGVGDGGGPDL